jgi:hypothetical protein
MSGLLKGRGKCWKRNNIIFNDNGVIVGIDEVPRNK